MVTLIREYGCRTATNLADAFLLGTGVGAIHRAAVRLLLAVDTGADAHDESTSILFITEMATPVYSGILTHVVSAFERKPTTYTIRGLI